MQRIAIIHPRFHSAIQVYSVYISDFVKAFDRQRRSFVEYSVKDYFRVFIRNDLVQV